MAGGTPPQSDSGSKSIYGLGPWGATHIGMKGYILNDRAGLAPDATGDQIFKGLAGQAPDVLAYLQQLLWQGGFYGQNAKGDKIAPVPGSFTEPDRIALQQAIKLAGETGQPLDVYLQSTADLNSSIGGGPGAQSKQFAAIQGNITSKTITVSNPTDIRAAFVAAAQKVLGRAPSQAEQDAFVAEYQNQERTPQQAELAGVQTAQQLDYQQKLAQRGAEMAATGGQPRTGPPPAPGEPSSLPRTESQTERGAVPSIQSSVPSTPMDAAAAAAGGPPGLVKFMNAMKVVESGDYAWKANSVGATGAYQIMASNWPSWAREAGVDPNDHSAGAQDQVAAYKFTQYYNAYGHDWSKVALAWYTGTPNPALDRPAPGNGPTPRQYWNRVQAALGSAPDTGVTPGVASGNQVVGQDVGPSTVVTNATAPPSATAAAEAKARQEHPTEASAYDYVKQFDALVQMMGPSASSVGSNR